MKGGLIILAAALVLLSLSGGGAGDVSRAERLAEAIATQEGFFVAGSRAQRNRNPGNLTQSFGFAVVGADGMFPIFASAAEGWAALRTQVGMMLDGTSRIYGPEMSITEVARRYTTSQQEEWAANVASYLGVPVGTSISEV